MLSNFFAKLCSQHSTGFTIIEAVVALTVVSVGIAASLTLSDRVVNIGGDNGKVAAATNLGREGLELVRANRDNNWNRQLERTSATDGSQLRSWDCYFTSATKALTPVAGPDPAVCDGFFRNLPGSGSDFAVNQTRGWPYFRPGAASTTSAEYLMCQVDPNTTAGTLSVPTYYHKSNLPAGWQCLPNAQELYRRVHISKSKNLNNGDFTLKAQVFVTYPGRTKKDISMEVGITNWEVGPNPNPTTPSGTAAQPPATAPLYKFTQGGAYCYDTTTDPSRCNARGAAAFRTVNFTLVGLMGYLSTTQVSGTAPVFLASYYGGTGQCLNTQATGTCVLGGTAGNPLLGYMQTSAAANLTPIYSSINGYYCTSTSDGAPTASGGCQVKRTAFGYLYTNPSP